MTPRARLRALLEGRPIDRLIVDIGTSTLTACRKRSMPNPGDGLAYSDTVMHLPISSAQALASLGSDTLRCGAAFAGAIIDENDEFLDRYGNTWIWADGEPAPLRHALGSADLRTIAAWARPDISTFLAPTPAEIASIEGRLLIMDAPSPGILDLSFRLRGYYELLLEMTDQWPTASALFDKALVSILSDIEAALIRIPTPDIVVYGDDLAFQTDLYFSEERFAFFLRPRLTRIFSVIRSMTQADILFHSCGAARSVFEDVVALGVRIVNFEPTADGMTIANMRAALGPRVVFHGVLDFAALAVALEAGNLSQVDRIVESIVVGWPMIAAPSDNIPGNLADGALHRAVHFLKALEVPLLFRDRGAAIEKAFNVVSANSEKWP